jgi:FlaA1/EpsC-like NDP-sugar epimerase
MKRFFMTIPEAVHLVLAAGGLAAGGELFVLNMGDPVPIVELAEDVIRLSGCRVQDIPIVFTGLRPGEKLEERLWETGATVEPTAHPDVLRVREPSGEHDEIEETLAFLRSAVDTGDGPSVLFALSTTVPTLEAMLRARDSQRI